MDWFLMLHGIVKYTGSTIMAIKFLSTDGFESDAVAVRAVCYVNDSQSRNLHIDFYPGQRIQFSAVRDQSSVAPEVWKAVAVWTTYKPLSCLKVTDWYFTVSKLYTNASLIKTILDGRVDLFKKNILIECQVVTYLNERIHSDLRRNVMHRIDDYDLNDIFQVSNASYSAYIEAIYGSVADFITYHSTVFEISARGNIFILMPTKCLDHYLSVTLPENIEKENSQLNCEVRQEVESRSVEKIYQLEVDAISYFYFRLIEIQEVLGIVYCLSSKCLEELLDRSPEAVQAYLKQTYRCLTDFLLFHKSAIMIGPRCTVFPTTSRMWDMYLKDGLKMIVPDDARSRKLFELFMCRQNLSEKTKSCPESLIKEEKKLNVNRLPLRRPLPAKVQPLRECKVISEEDSNEDKTFEDDKSQSLLMDGNKSVFTALNLLKL